MKHIIFALMAAIAASGCTRNYTKEDIALGTGAVTGALIGRTIGSGTTREVATIAGAIAGAYVGRSIGRYMDEVDRMRLNKALETTRTGQAASWRNPDSGNRYSVTPTRTTYTQSSPCREYSIQAVIGGRSQTVHGRACRQPDGKWVVS